MTVDPSVLTALTRLAELAAPGAVGAINTQVQKVTTGRANDQMISELKEMIQVLTTERTDLVNIAQTLKEQLVSEQITEEDIKRITETVLPAFKKLATQMSESMDAEALEKMEDGMEAIETMLSVDMLKVLQVVGFNYKRAIGEPLTQVIQQLITSLSRPDPRLTAENKRLDLELTLALANIAQDEQASGRWKQVLDTLRGNGNAQTAG